MRHLTKLGFIVTHVGGAGDAGADLVINAASGKVIVQCKAHSHAIGPAPVRDLFGSLQHHSAAAGWIVCLDGYSKAAKAFAKGKPIRLLTLAEILTMESLQRATD
jgi:restriction system protein